MLRNLLTVATLASAVVLLAACESTSKSTTMPESQPAMGMINDTCPMSGEPVSPGAAVSYMGYTVGMCCPGCEGGWKKMSDDDKMAFINKNK